MASFKLFVDQQFPNEQITYSDLTSFIVDQTQSDLLGKRELQGLNDRGIDAFLMIDQAGHIILDVLEIDQQIKDVYIFQSKNGSQSGYNEVLKASKYVSSFINDLIRKRKTSYKQNSTFSRRIRDFIDNGNPLINVKIHPIIFVDHDPDKPNDLEADAEIFKKIDSIEDVSFDFKSVFGISKLKAIKYAQKYYVNRVTRSDLRFISVTKHPYNSPYAMALTLNAYISEFKKFLRHEEESEKIDEGFFLENVRSGLGNVGVNKQISETFRNGKKEFPGDFWWLSNGITILATKVSQSSMGLITVENPQIINGQQTARTIFETKDDDIPNDWSVNIRIIEVSVPNNPKSDEAFQMLNLRTKIIRGLNTQTSIPEFAISAKDPTIDKIASEMLKRGLILIRRKNEELAFPNVEDIDCLTFEDFSKFLGSFLLEVPGEARGTTNKFISTYFDQLYINPLKKNEKENSKHLSDISIFGKTVAHYIEYWESIKVDLKSTDGSVYAKYPLFTFLMLDKKFGVERSLGDIQKSFPLALTEWQEFVKLVTLDGTIDTDFDNLTKSVKFNDIFGAYILLMGKGSILAKKVRSLIDNDPSLIDNDPSFDRRVFLLVMGLAMEKLKENETNNIKEKLVMLKEVSTDAQNVLFLKDMSKLDVMESYKLLQATFITKNARKVVYNKLTNSPAIPNDEDFKWRLERILRFMYENMSPKDKKLNSTGYKQIALKFIKSEQWMGEMNKSVSLN